eukprot:gnl/MRDRNA2_/MRDRNA2_15095_c0_seq1.p1 gnl/MRDRNA2_/MRDRNA2_15095_c0~~gnl/MRDRNA2_/MRDRNA2_15095_c0_seq1.p1  ORF type:complete len:384 (-),score=89.19 gnl/MRDRNA2_/MRDRNA2_15095_c0_seq1:112-1263(-)
MAVSQSKGCSVTECDKESFVTLNFFLISEGHFTDLVAELLRHLREEGQLALQVALRDLDEVYVTGERATVAITKEVAATINVANPTAAVEGLQLVAAFAQIGTERQQDLRSLGAVKHILSAMALFKDNADVQYAGMQTLSNVIGSYDDGLWAFVRHQGLEQVQNLMQMHPQNEQLQLRAVKLLSSVVAWPDGEELRRAAKFDPTHAIALTKQAMLLHPSSVEVQLAGMAALSGLIGDSERNLIAFASCGGLEIYYQAMLRHPEDVNIQEKCIKALAGGARWSNEVCKETGYCPEKTLALIKQAMMLHLDNQQIQIVATERLFENFLHHHMEMIAACGGVDLLRNVMVQHQNGGIRHCCKKILDAMHEQCPDVTAHTKDPKGQK